MKQMGERSAGNPHAAFDAKEAGNVAWSDLQQGVNANLPSDIPSAQRRIELFKLARQRFERGIGDRPKHPQRMILNITS